MTTSVPAQKKDRRLEIRTTARDREVIVRAAASTGRDITSFVSESAVLAAQRVLADRTAFVLDAKQAATWDALMDRPARDVPSLREFLERPSIFVDE
jgi:uncharacterized protein (DUF1778 family)